MRRSRLGDLVRGERWVPAGIGVLLLIGVVVGTGFSYARRQVVSREDAVADDLAHDLLDAEELKVAIERKGGSVRAYLLTGDPAYEQLLEDADRDARNAMGRLLERERPEDKDALEGIFKLAGDYQASVGSAIESRRRNASPDELKLFADSEARTKRFEIDRTLDDFLQRKASGLQQARKSSAHAAAFASSLDVFVVALAMVMFGGLVLVLMRATAMLQERQRLLEERNHDLDAFAGRISHDLRNALSPVSYAAGRLRLSSGDPAAVRDVAHKIERIVSRATGLIDGLLAFSRAGRPDSRESSQVPDVLAEVLEELAPAIASVKADVRVASLQAALIGCSPGLLHLVLLNLVSNAVKFLDGQPRRRVDIEGRFTDPGYEILISDTGPGMPTEAVSKIFEPFYRVPGTRVAGTGIGLATVRRVIDSHGGRIDVETSPGKGTRVRVWFPGAKPRSQDRLAADARH
jgi:signal transduction histidine kinase